MQSGPIDQAPVFAGPTPYGQSAPRYEQSDPLGPADQADPFGQDVRYGQVKPFDQPGRFEWGPERSFELEQTQGAGPRNGWEQGSRQGPGQAAGHGPGGGTGAALAPRPAYGQAVAYEQPQPSSQQPSGLAEAPYTQLLPAGYDDGQSIYPQPIPPKRSKAKWVGTIAVVLVVLGVTAVVVGLHDSGSVSSPTAGPSVSGNPLAAVTTGAPTDSDSFGGSGADTLMDYKIGECIELSGSSDNLTAAQVACTAAHSSGKVVGIVTSGTTGDPTTDATLCQPFKYDDNDFEETGAGDGTGVLYCLSSTNGRHDLRYAVKGSCIYRPSGTDVQTFVVDCSNPLANYVALGVLSDTTSDSACDDYSDDQENFFSPNGEMPTYVVCAKAK
jgi:hypothetical protein